MKRLSLRHWSALAAGIIGLSIIITSIVYNISHLDSYADQPPSFYRDNGVAIGYLIVLLVPLILRRYIWFFILLGVAAIFVAWAYFAR